MNRLKTAFERAPFLRSVSILATGTTAGQAILLFAAPFLTRLYSPEDFGALAVFSALVATLGVVSGLRYQLAIPIPDSELDAHSLSLLAALVTVGTSLLTAVLVFLFRERLANRLGMPPLASGLLLLPLGVLLLGLYQISIYHSVRQKNFSPLARTRPTQALATVLLQIGAAPLGTLALMLAQIAGQGAGVIMLGRRLLSDLRNETWIHTDQPSAQIFTRLSRVAARYRRFPLFSTWGALADTLSQYLPALLLGVLFGPVPAGLFALTRRVVSTPTKLIGSAVSQVFMSEAAASARTGIMGIRMQQIFEKLVAVAAPPCFILLLLGPTLFAWIFGPEWRDSGYYASLLAPLLLLQFSFSPLSAAFMVIERQFLYSGFQVTLAIVTVVAFGFGKVFSSEVIGIASLSILAASCYLVMTIFLFNASGIERTIIFRILGRQILWGFICSSPLLIIYIQNLTSSALTVIAFTISIITTILRYRYLRMS